LLSSPHTATTSDFNFSPVLISLESLFLTTLVASLKSGITLSDSSPSVSVLSSSSSLTILRAAFDVTHVQGGCYLGPKWLIRNKFWLGRNIINHDPIIVGTVFDSVHHFFGMKKKDSSSTIHNNNNNVDIDDELDVLVFGLIWW